jgi:hypothetical protein
MPMDSINSWGNVVCMTIRFPSSFTVDLYFYFWNLSIERPNLILWVGGNSKMRLIQQVFLPLLGAHEMKIYLLSFAFPGYGTSDSISTW